MAWPRASVDLHAYKAWRRSLVPLADGSIIFFEKKYLGTTQGSSIKEGSYFILEGTRPGLFAKDDLAASRVYHMTQCSKSGKKFKKQFEFSVEGIAAFLADDIVSISHKVPDGIA